MTKTEEHTENQEEAKENQTPEPVEGKGAGAPLTEPVPENLKAKLAELEQTIASLKDQLLRKAAEFENYRKRMENDFAAIVKFSNEDLITKFLPILDDFSRSLKAAKEQPEFELFYRGIELMHNKFVKILEAQGIKEIEAIGKPFDTYYHEALMQIPKEDVPPHTVIEEVEKGYTLHDKVIRHAKVIVAAEPQALKLPSSEETRPGTKDDAASKKNISDPAETQRRKDGKRE